MDALARYCDPAALVLPWNRFSNDLHEEACHRKAIAKLSQSYAYGYDADQLRGNVLEQASQLTVNDVKKISMNDE